MAAGLGGGAGCALPRGPAGAVAAACLTAVLVEIRVHGANVISRNLKATEHLPSMS